MFIEQSLELRLDGTCVEHVWAPSLSHFLHTGEASVASILPPTFTRGLCHFISWKHADPPNDSGPEGFAFDEVVVFVQGCHQQHLLVAFSGTVNRGGFVMNHCILHLERVDTISNFKIYSDN